MNDACWQFLNKCPCDVETSPHDFRPVPCIQVSEHVYPFYDSDARVACRTFRQCLETGDEDFRKHFTQCCNSSSAES